MEKARLSSASIERSGNCAKDERQKPWADSTGLLQRAKRNCASALETTDPALPGAARALSLSGPRMRKTVNIPAAVVMQMPDTVVPDSTRTTLLWDTEIEDSQGIHEDGASALLTAPVAGIYSIAANLYWEPDDTPSGFRETAITCLGCELPLEPGAGTFSSPTYAHQPRGLAADSHPVFWASLSCSLIANRLVVDDRQAQCGGTDQGRCLAEHRRAAANQESRLGRPGPDAQSFVLDDLDRAVRDMRQLADLVPKPKERHRDLERWLGADDSFALNRSSLSGDRLIVRSIDTRVGATQIFRGPESRKVVGNAQLGSR